MKNNEGLSRSDREYLYELFNELGDKLKEVTEIVNSIAFTFYPDDASDDEDDSEETDISSGNIYYILRIIPITTTIYSI